MKKIVHFVDGLNFGGIEKVVLMLSKYQVTSNYEVHIICLYSDQTDLVFNFPQQVKLHFLPFTQHKKGLFFYLLYLGKLCDLLKKISPDIVHAHNSSFSLFYLACGVSIILKRIMIIRTLHFSGSFLLRNNFMNKIRFLLDKRATNLLSPIIVAVSPFILESVRKLYPAYKSVYIFNGIDTELHFNPSKIYVNREKLLLDKFEKRIVIYVARLVDGKNHMTLFDAWEIVIKSVPNVCLCLVGDGPLQHTYEKEVEKRSLTSSVMFVGAVSNVNEYLSVSNIAVFPSLSEGLALSLLEKMSMCLPVIVSSIPAFTSIFSDDSPVLFYQTLDAKDLADKIICLLNDRNLCSKLGIQGRKFVQDKFSIDEMCYQYSQLYASI